MFAGQENGAAGTAPVQGGREEMSVVGPGQGARQNPLAIQMPDHAFVPTAQGSA